MAGSNPVSVLRLRRAARDLDGFAMTTIGLVVLALGLYALAVRPLASQAQSLRERVAGLESHAGDQSRVAQPVRPASQLAVFYEQLPDVAQAPEVVRQLHAHAHSAGLMLERGEYRPLPDTSAKLVRYQIVLPVKGSYPQVRQFLAGAMREMPELALDSIGFLRDKGASGPLEVQLQFTAFLRTPS
jgi:Tfp pilus assembly protein PilO